MRVTIDAVPLLVRSAGVKNYLYYWTRYLRQESHGTDIRLFPFLGEPSLLDHEDSVANPLSTYARLGLLFLLNRIPNDAIQWMDPHTDIFHTCKVLNPPRRAKLTATIHDLTCWILPETHSPANVAADRAFARRILQRADGLIAVSEATRCRCRAPPQPAARKNPRDPPWRHRPLLPRHPRRYSRRPFPAGPAATLISCLSAPSSRARTSTCCSMPMRSLPPSVRQEFDLVLAGPPGWAQSATMARLRQPSPGVRYLGYVPEQDLAGLFAGATAFVYPSLYEGFGFPVAQAMAAGTRP